MDTLETQVVVIGGGGAGLAAAVAAAEKGANVILLEKNKQLGGNTQAALDIFACESPVQKRLKVETSKDQYFQIAMRFSHWAINPRIIRTFINKSGDTISWLENKGLSFTLNKRKFTFYGQPLPSTGHDAVGTDGSGVVGALAKSAKELGVKILFDTQAKKLLKNTRGEMTGVVASQKGKDFKIKASSAVIASGGFGGNKAMMKKYNALYNDNVSLDGFPNMGDGILMALKVGAATEGLGTLQYESKGLPKEPKQIWLLSWRPHVIWLNKKGERFADESIDNVFEGANPVLRQPERISYSVFDETIKQKLIKVMNEEVMPHYYGRGREKGVARWLPPPEKIAPEDIDTLLKLAVDKGDVIIASSLDELANWIGCKPDVLRSTIDEYNEFCTKGHDDWFAKNPEYLLPFKKAPYYAIKCGTRILGSLGGLKINHKMEVLNKKDDPIPGLYAAGIDTGGWEIETYNQFLMGTTFSFALNSGRIAGENAAKYVTDQ